MSGALNLMKAGISMIKEEKIFLEFFDRKEDIYVGDGILREEISGYREKITYFIEGSIVEHKITDVGGGYADFCDVFQVGSRFFTINYTGVGKDLDEYVDFSYPVEVKPVAVSKTVYEEM